MTPERGRSAARLAAALLWLALAALFAVRLGGRSLDDFFITYRYAQNLAHGHGFVFNPGERVFGTTAPGLGLLLAAGHAATRIPVHWLGTLSTAAALVGTALLLLAEAGARGRTAEACIGGTLLLSNTFLWACHGAEGPVVVVLLLLAARWGEERPIAAGALAGFAAWCRPDAGLAVGLLGLLLWRERRRLPWRYGLAAAGVLATGALLALAWFGTVVPNSWRAKQVEAAVLGEATRSGANFWPAALPLAARHLGPALPWIVLLGLIGLWPLARHAGRPGRLLVIQAAALALAYPLLGVNFAVWYVLPMLTALLYGAAFAAGAAGRAVAARHRWAGPAVAAALLLPAVLSIAPQGFRWYRNAGHPLHFEGYRAAGLWIHRDSAPDGAVSSMEVGTLAYFSDRRVEDLQGLVTPRSIPFTARGDLSGAFLAAPTRYVVVRPGLQGPMGKITGRRWFRRSYKEIARFDPATPDWTLVYRKKPRAVLP